MRRRRLGWRACGLRRSSSSPNQAPRNGGAWPSGLVVVLRGQFWQIGTEPIRPANHFVDASFQRQGVPPAEFGTQLDAVEHVGRILARSLRRDLDAIVERLAEAF